MLDKISRRLIEAQDRLRAALIAGEPTATYRAAIATIQADFEKAQARQEIADTAAEQRRTELIGDRAAVITKEAHQRVAEAIAKFPIPEEPAND
jgi:hypothetical protein